MRTEGTAFVVLNRSLDAKAHLYHPDKPGRTLCGIKLKATERQRMGETVCRHCMRVEDKI